MKIIYNNTELQDNTKKYSALINKPSLNGHLLQGDVSLDTLSLYNKPEVEKLVEATSQIRLVASMPADPEPSMTYYVGPDERNLYDVILVNDAKQQINMGTTQFGQYKSGSGINVAFDNTININTDGVSTYIDSEGNLASSLDGEALPSFTGATASSAGTKGLVPKPVKTQQNAILRGNGAWLAYSDLVNMFYPVGAIMLTYKNTTDPSTNLPGTTWEKLSSGYVLWNDDNGGGGTIAAAMPNLKGGLGNNFLAHCAGATSSAWSTQDGCLKFTHAAGGVASWPTGGSGTAPYGKMIIDFSNNNSIYGNSTTVQPPVTKIVAWKRTA